MTSRHSLHRPFLWMAALVALLLGGTTAASAQACPQTDNPVARERLAFFFIQARFDSARAVHGFADGAHNRARVASDASGDAWFCNHLRTRIRVPALLTAPWTYTIYVVDNRFYVVWVKSPISQTRIRITNGAMSGELYHAPFVIYDGLGGEIYRAMF